MIPVVPAEDVLAGHADAALAEGGRRSGFLMLSGADEALGLADPRNCLLALFGPDDRPRMQMLRNKYDPARKNVYRGFFPSEPEKGVMSEGVDIGPDVADPARCGDGSDPLTEPTPMPDLPGWREATAAYYQGLERLGRAVVAGLLRGLGSDAARWERLFDGSISTRRVLHYSAGAAKALPEDRVVETPERKTWVITRPHTDSGFVTPLWQDPTGGLQAQAPDGTWTDVP
ncbi:MAG: isopenicillin N synthase family oxygenase, partial [Xanthomonadales bacterium]|nr:isopenicillin N synthase family oxygenase [Xanthomonadales bacterium]